MEYWEPVFLTDIVGAIGEPLNIDDRTSRKELGTYARLLVDIDFDKPLLEEILIQRERFEFLMFVEYENLLDFYDYFQVVGHSYSQCRLLNNKARRVEKKNQYKLSKGHNNTNSLDRG